MRYIIFIVSALLSITSCSDSKKDKVIYFVSADSSIEDLDVAFLEYLDIEGYSLKKLSITISGEQLFEDVETQRLSDIIEAYDISDIFAVNSNHLSEDLIADVTQRHFTDYESMSSALSEHYSNGTVLILDHWYDIDQESIATDQAESIFDNEKLYELAHDKFWKFVDAQNLIANEQNQAIVSSLIENAKELFIDQGAKIEVQNKSQSTPIVLTPEGYFQRLAHLDRYEGIELAWDKDLSVVTPWKDISAELPQKRATVRGNQRFTGYKKSTVLYSDQIEKQVELHAELVESIDLTGKKTIEWQVLLGSIRTADTPQPINT